MTMMYVPITNQILIVMIIQSFIIKFSANFYTRGNFYCPHYLLYIWPSIQIDVMYCTSGIFIVKKFSGSIACSYENAHCVWYRLVPMKQKSIVYHTIQVFHNKISSVRSMYTCKPP